MKNMRKRSVLIKRKQTILAAFDVWNCEDLSFFQAFAMKEESEALRKFLALSENQGMEWISGCKNFPKPFRSRCELAKSLRCECKEGTRKEKRNVLGKRGIGSVKSNEFAPGGVQPANLGRV